MTYPENGSIRPQAHKWMRDIEQAIGPGIPSPKAGRRLGILLIPVDAVSYQTDAKVRSVRMTNLGASRSEGQ